MMLWDLVKFKIRTTFRKSIIFSVILILFFMYLEFPFSSNNHLPPLELYGYAIGGIAFISFYFLLGSIYTSFFIQKSDVDFLYMLPFNERDIVIAQSISSLLLSLFSTIFTAYLLFPALSFLSILVVLMVSIMNTFSYFAFKKHRKVASAIITVWMLSSLLKFPFSPLSMVFGYIYGYFILAALDVIVLVLGMRNASVEDLINEFYRRQGVLTQGNKATTSILLYSSSPFVAMLKRNLNFVEIGGRVNLGGVVQQINRRVKLYKMLIITVVIAVVYYIIFTFLLKSQAFFIEDFIAGFIGFYIIMFTSQSAFINEPLWLNLSVMTPIDYARKYVLTKTLSAFIIFLPISVSLILLNPVAGLGSLLIPFVFVYVSSIYARFYPVSQSQMPQYGFRNMTVGYLSAASFIPIYLDVFFPIGGVVATVIFTLPFLLSRGYWEKTFEKTITSL